MNSNSQHSGNRKKTTIIINHEFTGTKSLAEVFVPVIAYDICKELKAIRIIDNTDNSNIN